MNQERTRWCLRFPAISIYVLLFVYVNELYICIICVYEKQNTAVYQVCCKQNECRPRRTCVEQEYYYFCLWTTTTAVIERSTSKLRKHSLHSSSSGIILTAVLLLRYSCLRCGGINIVLGIETYRSCMLLPYCCL